MTAWGLFGLLEVAHLPIPNVNSYLSQIQSSIARAVQYLLNNFKENNGQFFDRSVVGTGHRGVLNLQYPVYAYSFPLVALSRAQKLITGKYQTNQNEKFTKEINKLADILQTEEIK